LRAAVAQLGEHPAEEEKKLFETGLSPVQVRPAAPSLQVQIPSSAFMSTESCSLGLTVREGIYDYEKRLERCRRIIAGFGANGETAPRLSDHLASLGLSIARVSKIAGHMLALLRVIDFDLRSTTGADVERIAAWINRNPHHRESTKHDKKLVLRKLIQYAKYGSCDRSTPMPPEASWINLTVKGRDARATPETLLAHEDFEAMVKAADNPGDRAMLHVLFEAALRPGKLLGMNVESVEFKKDYCIITVNGKTGIKRIPLVAPCMGSFS